MKKTLLSLTLLLLAGSPAFAGEEGIRWGQPRAAVFATAPLIKAQQFKTYSASLPQIYAALPHTSAAPFTLQLPFPDGSFHTFTVRYTPISTAAFYQRNAGIETYTYTAEQVGNSAVTAKLDVTPYGFHAMILDGEKQYFIDPYSRETTSDYIVYDKRNLSAEGRQRMACEMEAVAVPPPPPSPEAFVSGTIIRDFRLALSCTGEYAQAVTSQTTPTKLQVLAQMITTLNRVNGVFEKELALHFTLIPFTDTLIFIDGKTDPFTNNSASALITENQIVTDSLIGVLEYDMGHVFSTGGGGLASLGVLCNDNNKARGVTGSATPVGDPFDIDYVAHEMGHQLNAQHTFNANTGSCSGNGSSGNAFEPGSGSTIMAYAGICGSADNIQPNSDAYFHTSSLKVIATFLATRTCGVTSPSNNIPPIVPAVAANYTIPYLTPFELTAPPGTSGNGTGALRYCWEQYDLGSFRSSFASTTATGPIFRSFPPNDQITRVFPTPRRLVRNTFNYLGEKLPPVARTLNFRLTVRDTRNGAGTFNILDGGNVVLTVVATPDTFGVSSFAAPATVAIAGVPTLLEWNVAGTSAASVNAPLVDIYYSVDSGYTFPYLLQQATANDGSEMITLPAVATTKGRIKVKASNNVFFSLTKTPFQVLLTAPESISTVAYNKEIKLSPVPATDRVTVQNTLKPLDAQLVNALGQLVWQGVVGTGSNSVSVSHLPRGAYYFKFSQLGTGIFATRQVVLQ